MAITAAWPCTASCSRQAHKVAGSRAHLHWAPARRKRQRQPKMARTSLTIHRLRVHRLALRQTAKVTPHTWNRARHFSRSAEIPTRPASLFQTSHRLPKPSGHLSFDHCRIGVTKYCKTPEKHSWTNLQTLSGSRGSQNHDSPAC